MSKVINTLTWIGIAVIGVPIAFTMCTFSDNYNKYSDRAEEIKASQNTANHPTVNDAARPAITENQKQAAVDYFISDKEPTVKDAVWADQLKDTLFIGVIDDGTIRDGMADYVCQVLISDFGLSQGDASVYIMDIVKITKDNEWRQLGRSDCQWQQAQ